MGPGMGPAMRPGMRPAGMSQGPGSRPGMNLRRQNGPMGGGPRRPGMAGPVEG